MDNNNNKNNNKIKKNILTKKYPSWAIIRGIRLRVTRSLRYFQVVICHVYSFLPFTRFYVRERLIFQGCVAYMPSTLRFDRELRPKSSSVTLHKSDSIWMNLTEFSQAQNEPVILSGLSPRPRKSVIIVMSSLAPNIESGADWIARRRGDRSRRRLA